MLGEGEGCWEKEKGMEGEREGGRDRRKERKGKGSGKPSLDKSTHMGGAAL
jgi:hypothetical protein